LIKRYPVHEESFETCRSERLLYADRTQIIRSLVSNYSYVLLLRPSGFGKTFLMSTLESYFRGRKDLFEGLAISEPETEWKEHPVLCFSFSHFTGGTAEDLEREIQSQLGRLEQEYGLPCESHSSRVRLRRLVYGLSRRYGMRAAVLVDGYDEPALAVLPDLNRFEGVQLEMEGFLQCLSSMDDYLQFVLVSGRTKPQQLSMFSLIDKLEDISMMPEFGTLLGITEDEFCAICGDGIRGLAGKYGMSESEAVIALREMCGGYRFSDNGAEVYCTRKLLSALESLSLQEPEKAQADDPLMGLVRRRCADLMRFDGIMADESELSVLYADGRSMLPLLTAGGYLTIKDYDPRSMRYTLSFPNTEAERCCRKAAAAQ